MKELVLAAALLPLLVLACATPEPTAEPTKVVLPTAMVVEASTPLPTADPAQALVGTLWLWQGTLMSDGTEIEPQDPTRFTLAFDEEGGVNVVADCNVAAGEYVIDGPALELELGPVTLAECEEPSPVAEYLEGLANVDSSMLDDGDLILMLAVDSGTMRFSAVP